MIPLPSSSLHRDRVSPSFFSRSLRCRGHRDEVFRFFPITRTGFVLDRLSSQIIPGFNSEQHKTLLCNANRCNASRDKVSSKLIEQGNFDTRLSAEVCDRLAQMEKKSWEDYRWKKHQLRKEALGLVEDLAEKKSMRTVRRSEKEEKQARERHLRVVENL